jgi:hypothetical protein
MAFPIRGLVLALAFAGCGGSGKDASSTAGGGPTPSGASCATLAKECKINQQICVGNDGDAKCQACAEGTYAAPSGKCESLGKAALSHEFAMFTVQPGEEILGKCQSWTLGNATELWVHTVELVQDEASHHSNWTYVPSDRFEGPDGVWTCKDRGYNQLSAALAGGVLYAQSTQATHEIQRFPNGAAVRIPPYSRIIGDVHLLNTSTQPITGRAKLNLYDLPKSEVKVKLVPFHLTYEGLDIPPQSESRFYGECALEQTFQDAAKSPFDMVVYYALPHTHALGRRFFLSVIGGPKDGLSLVNVEGFNGEARGFAYDPPIDLKGATGLRFGCEFTNPRTVPVKWGFGDQEMCEMLGFAAAPIAFEAEVKTANAAGKDGSKLLFTGPCTTFGAKWDFEKPGGPPPK